MRIKRRSKNENRKKQKMNYILKCTKRFFTIRKQHWLVQNYQKCKFVKIKKVQQNNAIIIQQALTIFSCPAIHNELSKLMCQFKIGK